MVSKTTLANTLVKSLTLGGYNCDAVHSPGPQNLNSLKKFIDDNLVEKKSNKIRIFDRFPIIEEEVYGKLLRGKNKFSQKYSDKILDKIDLFIFCYPGMKSVLNWGERDQMDGVKDNVVEIINAYNRFEFDLITKNRSVIEYNYNTHIDSIFDLIQAIEDIYQEENNEHN